MNALLQCNVRLQWYSVVVQSSDISVMINTLLRYWLIPCMKIFSWFWYYSDFFTFWLSSKPVLVKLCDQRDLCDILGKPSQKSRIRETLNLSTDEDSSTDATVGWTKNTQKPKKIITEKNNLKRKNSKTSRDMQKLAIYPSTRGL